MLVDIHCHLDHMQFRNDIDSVIANAKQDGVKAIITSGINPETNRIALGLAVKYDIVKCSLGIYPPDALQAEIESGSYPMKENRFDIDAEIKFLKENKESFAAVGEVGLDYANCKDKEMQISVFKKMIKLAKELDKPVIIHSRKAEEDCINILEESDIKNVILHCFCGNKKLVERAIKLGYYFSIPCNIVRAYNFQEIVKKTDINHIFTETDAPYLSPFKGVRNEPRFVIETIKKIAELKGMDVEEVKKNIFMNYKSVFE